MALFLPPLNAIERVEFVCLRERFLAHPLWPTYDAIADASCAAECPPAPGRGLRRRRVAGSLSSR